MTTAGLEPLTAGAAVETGVATGVGGGARFTRMPATAALASTVLALAGYGIVQQALRSGANDPQVALAQDARVALDAGAPASAVVPSQSIDLHRSLAPWVAVYDGSRKLLASSAMGVDVYPTSVFNAVGPGERDQVTWQPDASTRQATVVVRWSGGWVVAGLALLGSAFFVVRIRHRAEEDEPDDEDEATGPTEAPAEARPIRKLDPALVVPQRLCHQEIAPLQPPLGTVCQLCQT